LVSVILFVLLQTADANSCINFNKDDRLIEVACVQADLPLVEQHLNKSDVIKRDPNDTKTWILNAGLLVHENSIFYINSSTVDWLKVVPTKVTNENKTVVNNINNPNGIHVYGSLQIDSVKITSWDPLKRDVISFNLGKRPGEEHTKSDYDTSEPRVFIRVSKSATGTTNITNSELAYMGYSCSRCSGLSYYGGLGSIIQGNEIHHLLKGFYSNKMGFMTIDNNHIHDNYLYGIDPHTGTRDMVIQNNIVHHNNASGIICSKNCQSILIEGNKVYQNNDGIAFSIETVNSTAKNNLVYDQKRCISFSRYSNNNHVYNNSLLNCNTAVYIGDSSNNNISNNKIVNSESGIILTNTSNILRQNELYDSKFGIVVLVPSNFTGDYNYNNRENIMHNVTKKIVFNTRES
ncbi:MAG TPA: right-handed parallel beta-helix repeat-containing protein, partial [Nitrososphaeraceae archaeon]|nr:right-handed parallel beta-helix repeat-containing protein [Nitrososphaeraceae archaeon]